MPDACLHVECPDAERCEVIDGLAQCLADWAPRDEEPAPPPAEEPDAGPPMGGAGGSPPPLGGVGGSVVTLPDAGPTNDAGAADGGTSDCGCRTGEGGQSGWWLPMLLLLGLRRRRTRM